MMNLNRLFFTSPNQKLPLDGNKMIWRHNDSSNGFNTFYNEGGHNGPSALGVSFNGYTNASSTSSASNLTSSNKIYKSFSIQGGNNVENVQGASLFKVNNNSTNIAEDRHLIADLQFKGTAIYGEIGKEDAMSGMNIKAIGRIRNVYKWMSIDQDGNSYWRHFTGGTAVQSLVALDGLHVDENGNNVAPDLPFVTDELYAFEIESYMSNNPIPSTITGGDFSQYVKFFTGRANADGTDMQSTPYTTIPSTPPYLPAFAQYQENFAESVNFADGQNYGSYLSFGDPYFDDNNAFKKGNFLMIRYNSLATTPHVAYENTPGANATANNFSVAEGEDNLAFQGREVLFAMTPGIINGADPHGTFADAYVTLGSADFEVTSFNVEYELTEYDHGGRSSNLVSKK
tara:strand:- start:12921 stop:14120 length:1200 start_codon:yes stop_codon:yes gene_type:complete